MYFCWKHNIYELIFDWCYIIKLFSKNILNVIESVQNIEKKIKFASLQFDSRSSEPRNDCSCWLKVEGARFVDERTPRGCHDNFVKTMGLFLARCSLRNRFRRLLHVVWTVDDDELNLNWIPQSLAIVIPYFTCTAIWLFSRHHSTKWCLSILHYGWEKNSAARHAILQDYRWNMNDFNNQ